MIVLVLDATRPLAGEQEEMLNRFPNATDVVNKSDRPSADGLERVEGIRTVAITGFGVDELRAAIVQFFCGSPSIPLELPSLWTSRQRGIVERTLADGAALRDL